MFHCQLLNAAVAGLAALLAEGFPRLVASARVAEWGRSSDTTASASTSVTPESAASLLASDTPLTTARPDPAWRFTIVPPSDATWLAKSAPKPDGLARTSRRDETATDLAADAATGLTGSGASIEQAVSASAPAAARARRLRIIGGDLGRE